jgi:general secretion pathway protein A
MRAMINYRLSVARNFESSPPVFSFGGLVAISLATRGYPRKVVFLCHEVILKMIIRGRQKAGWFLVRSCIQERERPLLRKIRWAMAAVLFVAIFGMSVSALRWQGTGVDSENKSSSIQVNQMAAVSAAEKNVLVYPVDNLNDAQRGEPEVRDIKMPDQIGQITMAKRRTIWWTILNIYGETDQRIMKNVYAVNPHIQDRDVIYEGTVITLPAIPAKIKPVEADDVIIALERGQDLEMMYNYFRNNPDEQKLPPLMFISFWGKKKGFEFALVIDQKFKNIESANEVISKLPPVYAARAKILSQWDEDTVFFNRRALQY